MKLTLAPISFADACAFVAQHHRHHNPPRGHKFSLMVHDGEEVRGVAMVGRSVARHLDDGLTLEVVRLTTDGTPNACSFLLGAAWRAAKALGYTRLVTFTLATEPGGSLRAAGWRVVGQSRGGEWNRPGRPRPQVRQPGIKTLWEAGNP